MADACVFCRIAAGEVAADIVYENDAVVAFRDVHPVAPTHILVIPRRHIAGPSSLDEATASVMADLFLAAKAVAEREGIAAGGYRLVMNQGENGGQSVFHLHLHVLGGRRMAWPPG
jgi:histidine triad (HIT) family protein